MPYVEREDVAFYYERFGQGRPSILLVHGWCCDRTYLAPQARHLIDAGYDVVAPDLRGHGLSDKPPEAYGISDFAADVAWFIRALELDRPVVIGHSMGGVVAYDLACRYPGLASAIVMIDSSVVVSPAGRAAMPAILAKLRGSGYRAALRDLVAATLFIPTDDPERKSSILDAMTKTPQHVIAGAYAGFAEFDPPRLPPEPATPSLYIAADEIPPRSNVARLGELAPGLLFGQTVGSGHFCQLEVPDQVNSMIDRFLALCTPSKRSGPA